MSDRVNQNIGVIGQLLKRVRYAVEAKNGSLIPCVEYTLFQVIHRDLPAILLGLRQKQCATLTAKFEDGWRLAHGNDNGDLPEFTVKAPDGTGKVVPKVHDNARLPTTASLEEQKYQQFQEYDVSMMLKQHLGTTKIKGSKEMSDLGATRVVVDECFEHVYFSLEHYREIEDNEFGTLNPWVFVLFSEPSIQDMVRLDKLDDFKKKFEEETRTRSLARTGQVPANLYATKVTNAKKEDLVKLLFNTVFEQNNFVEDKEIGKSLVRKGKFGGITVTILVPAQQRRRRRGSLTIQNVTLATVLQAQQPPVVNNTNAPQNPNGA